MKIPERIEALRKRALANGGGLGLESKGAVNRMILESRGGWTESMARKRPNRSRNGLSATPSVEAVSFMTPRCTTVASISG